jgi:hypothetical protein
MQGWEMPEGRSWEHPMSREDDEKPEPVNLTSGGFTHRFIVSTLEGSEHGIINIAISDDNDGDLFDSAILEALSISEYLDEEALGSYWIKWGDPNRGEVFQVENDTETPATTQKRILILEEIF